MASYGKSVAAGALGGLAGTLAMNGFQLVVSAATKAITGQAALDLDKEATATTAQAISRTAFSHELTESEIGWSIAAVQCSVGTALGAMYGLLAETFPPITAGQGSAYGAAAWLAGDEIAAPLMGLAHGPAMKSVSGHVNALASHLVYAVVTNATRNLILSAT